MEITALIVDDEPNAREGLEHMLNHYCKGVEIVGMAAGVEQGIAMVKAHDPDLIFLDVEMPDGNGFQLLSAIKSRSFEVIFTTAYDQYAIEAIKNAALDYLVKPFEIDELEAAVEKAKRKKKEGKSGLQKESLSKVLDFFESARNQKIVVPDRDKYFVVSVNDIVYCKASGSYTELIYSDRKKVMSSNPLKTFEDKLSGHGFYRIHQSYLINLEYLNSISKGRRCFVQMVNGDELEVARARKNDFMTKVYG